MSTLCLKKEHVFIIIKEERKKVDAEKGVTDLAETSSSEFDKLELLSACTAEGTSASWQGKYPGGTEPLQHLQRTSPLLKIAWMKHLLILVTHR